MQEKELIKKLEDWIENNRKDFVQDVFELVRVRSVRENPVGNFPFGEGPAKVIDKAIEIGRKYGYETRNTDYHTVDFLHKGKTDKELGMLGHIDVVHEGEGWDYSPYDPIEKDGYLIGRGAGDNKGPSIAMLYAMRAIDELGIELNHSIRTIWGANEETGMQDVKHYLTKHNPPEISLVGDACFPLCIGEKGILTADLTMDIGSDSNLLEFEGGLSSNAVPDSAFIVLATDFEKVKAALAGTELTIEKVSAGTKISAKGIARHAAFPEGGKSATNTLAAIVLASGLLEGNAECAVKFIAEAFADYYGEGLGINFEDDISGKTTHIGGYIKLKNGILSQNINVRYAIKTDREKMFDNLNKTANTAGFAVENISDSPPRYDSPEDPKIKLLIKTTEDFVGGDMTPIVIGGGTHARNFPNAIPYGPEILREEADKLYGGPHSVNEGVKLETLLNAIKIYAVTLIRLDELLS